MPLPSLPAQGSTAWYPWASSVHTLVIGTPLRPGSFGAVGDGTTDDTAALTAMYAATGDRALFEAGKTYQLTGTLTITKDTDLNGATLTAAGDLVLGAGVELRNGSVTVHGRIRGTGLTGLTVRNLVVTNTDSTGDGIKFTSCTNVLIDRVTVTGGFRGVVLDSCDRFAVTRCKVSGLTASGAIGILALAATGAVHGDAAILDNTVTDCYFGIVASGGEADSTQPGFATDHPITDVRIAGNTVTVTTPDTLIGCIFATRGQRIDISHNVINGGHDVGVDFEYCTHSVAVGNRITNITAGGLSAIHGCSHILFTGNVVIYDRSTAGSATTSGVVWANTGPWVGIVRDDPKHVTFRGNHFASLNGTLGRFSLGETSEHLTMEDNTFFNCYLSGFGSGATDTSISNNRFAFDITTAFPVIYVQQVQRCHVVGNEITLPGGVTINDDTRKYITVYDGGTPYSDSVYIIDNTVDDKIGQGIVIASPNTAMHAWVTGNRSDRIATFWNSGSAPAGFTYELNYKLTAPGHTSLTAHDNAGLVLTVPTL